MRMRETKDEDWMKKEEEGRTYGQVFMSGGRGSTVRRKWGVKVQFAEEWQGMSKSAFKVLHACALNEGQNKFGEGREE